MGSPLAGRLARALRAAGAPPLTAFDVSPTAVERFAAEHGEAVRVAPTASAVGKASADCVFLSLPTTTQAREVCDSALAQSLARGAAVVDCTSGEPSQLRGGDRAVGGDVRSWSSTSLL